MRSYKLINSAGETCDLTSRVHFLREVKGMGFGLENTYQRRGRNWITLESNLQQQALTGKIRFHSDEEYRAFALFARRGPLTLIYKHDEDGAEYKRSCLLTSLSKDEKDGTRTYDTSVTLTTLSAWYNEVEAVVMPVEDVTSEVYPMTYPIAYATVRKMEISVRNEAEDDSPAELYIYGPCTNPTWRHYANGELIGTGALTATIPDGNYVVVSTAGGECTIREYDKYGELVHDLYGSSDFSTKRFIYLQRGRNRVVVSTGGTDVRIILKGRIEYVTV